MGSVAWQLGFGCELVEGEASWKLPFAYEPWVPAPGTVLFAARKVHYSASVVGRAFTWSRDDHPAIVLSHVSEHADAAVECSPRLPELPVAGSALGLFVAALLVLTFVPLPPVLVPRASLVVLVPATLSITGGLLVSLLLLLPVLVPLSVLLLLLLLQLLLLPLPLPPSEALAPLLLLLLILS